MAAFRTLPCVFFAAAGFVPLAAMSQFASNENAAASSWFLPAGHQSLGLNPGRSSFTLSCSNVAYLCDDKDRIAQLAGRTTPSNWGIEVAQVNFGNISRFGSTTRAQGLNLSLIGKASLGHSLHVCGRAGTMWGRTEASNFSAGNGVAGSDQGFGFTYGAGVGYDITPRLSATLEWDSNDLRFSGGTHDSLRSTSIGLKLRY